MADEHASSKGKTSGSTQEHRSESPGSEQIAQVLHSSHREDRDPAALRPRRQPRQARSRETVATILQAAAEVISQLGYDRASTNKIAACAGVSIGSLYQYFPNKDAILVSLLKQHRSAVISMVEKALENLGNLDVSFTEALRALFNELVSLHGANPKLNKVLSEEVPHAPVIQQMHREEIRSYAIQIERVLRSRPEIHVQNYTVASYVLTQATGSLSRWLVHEAPDFLDKQSFINEAVTMLAGYAQGCRKQRRTGTDSPCG